MEDVGAGNEEDRSASGTTAERIVRALAAEQYPGCLGSCRFCEQGYDPLDLDGTGWHAPDCPWRLAGEWVAREAASGPVGEDGDQ